MLRVFKVCMGRRVTGKKIGKEDLWSFVMKKICAWQKHGSLRIKENHS